MSKQTVHVYRIPVEVSKDNPSFNFWLDQDLPFIKVKAVITDKERRWKEVFKVTSLERAEEQVLEVIQFFNDTRPFPDEKERHYVGLYLESEELMNVPDDNGMSGWLNPAGEFFACGFGEHSRYAKEIMRNHQARSKDAADNDHIPMSHYEQSSFSHMAILGKITIPQEEWLNLWFDKLSPVQKAVVKNAFEEQGLKLDYDW